jgi:hypothetical protein
MTIPMVVFKYGGAFRPPDGGDGDSGLGARGTRFRILEVELDSGFRIFLGLTPVT